MGRQQGKLLVCSATGIALLASSLFALAWFRIELMGSAIEIDLHSASLCNPAGACTSVPLGKLSGMYPATSTVSFFAGLALLVLVVVQSASKLVTGVAHDRVTRIGYLLGVTSIVGGFAAGYLFGPDGSGLGNAIANITIERTWAPLSFLIGSLASLGALYFATLEATEDDVALFKPVHVDRRLPVTPISGVHKVPTPPPSRPSTNSDTRTKAPSSTPPYGGRPTPSGGFTRTEGFSTPSSGFPRPRSLTPGGGFGRADLTPTGTTLPGRSLTPGGGFPRTDAPTRPPTEPGARTRPPTQPPFNAEAPRGKPSTQQPFADPARTKTSSQQPFVARTTSPGIAEPARGKPSSQQPFVARTTSPSGIADPARTKTSSQQPFVARTTSPSGIADPTRAKAPSQPPDATRTRPPTQPPIDSLERSRTSSSGPIDLAARLSAAKPNPFEQGALEVSIRPPLPSPEPVPPDQIPVDPAAGLTIRKRTQSSAPLGEMQLPPVPEVKIRKSASVVEPLPVKPPEPALPDAAFAPPIAIETPPESGLLIRQRRPSAAPPTSDPNEDSMPRITVDGLESLTEAILATAKADAAPAVEAPKPPELPEHIRGKIKYAAIMAELVGAGLKVRREDGLEKLVSWGDIVGVIARRLPADKPFEGATFVDLVSTAGSTVRVLPWTKLEGHTFDRSPVERARELVNVVAAMALDAKLDPATKRFAEGTGEAAQLPNVDALSTHDAKVG